MLRRIAQLILDFRLTILMVLAVCTIFMAYKSRETKIVYEFAKLLPENDSASVSYDHFKDRFGLDGNILLLSIQDSNIFQLAHFQDWYSLSESIKKIKGIQEVVSVARVYNLLKDDSLEKFRFNPVLKSFPTIQTQVDSVRQIVLHLPFYDGFLFNSKDKATVLAVTFDKKDLNTKRRVQITDTIQVLANQYGQRYNLKVHYSGLPYIRTVLQRLVSREMILFLGLAFGVTILILFLFFRNPMAVLFSLLVVIVGVVFSFGTLGMLGYRMTVLTGLIPPLIIVIGVPNCILIINKYHLEYAKYGNKLSALLTAFEKISVTLFFANLTTAIGFAVFCFTHTTILFEFGLVASLNVMVTYIISIVLIPIAFSYLAAPTKQQVKHLESPRLIKFLSRIERWVVHNRKLVYAVVIFLLAISFVGISKIKPLGYVVDDLPRKHQVYADMHYFEDRFHGVLPFELSIDTRKENGVFADNGRVLYKINTLQKLLAQYPEFSKPVSVAEGIKFANQAYHDGNSKFYRLPGALDLRKIGDYASEAKQRQNTFKGFLDSTKRYTRVSVQMADIGSIKMAKLMTLVKPRIDSVFNYDKDSHSWISPTEQTKVDMTGFSVMFLKGNDFLIDNLLQSVLLAVVLIGLVMFLLFANFRMVVIAIVPSLVPLIVTAGLMGFFNIHLKPSTILIFSIAFGIASDGTLYFLTKYKQEMKAGGHSISHIVSNTIRETGISMVYTAVILASGFGIFAASEFGGTAALGILVSFTLIVAYCSNLILLPCFLLSLEKRADRRNSQKFK